jgi:hypothetical protein
MENATPADTPYRSGHTIDDIPKTTLDDLEQAIITTKYQSLVGSLLWIAYVTRPDVCITTSLLAQYNTHPPSGHYDAARDVLKYFIGTSDHCIRFAHKTNTTLVNIIGFVPAPDATSSDVNWGPQNASVPSPSQPPKIIDTNYMISLYGQVTYRSGGLISWSIFREARTSRSSCESEIKSANEATRVTQHLHHVISNLHMHDTTKPTPVYNDNQECIDWSKSTCIKNLHHFNIRENVVREAVQHKEIGLQHHPGIRNPADMFTKEHKGKSHFTALRECLVISRVGGGG